MDDVRIARRVLETAGRTFASEAGIRLRNTPAPLWQLLVLSNLLSARISGEIAIDATRELLAAGGTTGAGMLKLTWQQRVDALGRGRYVRYDESTATRLGECAMLLRDRYRGDLRRLAAAADGSARASGDLLRAFPGIGPAGVKIFHREVQAVWPYLRPCFDSLALTGADLVHLPRDPAALAGLVDGDALARFAAGLVRVSRDAGLAEAIRS